MTEDNPALATREEHDIRVYDLVLEGGLLSREQLDEILQPGTLTSPRMPTQHR